MESRKFVIPNNPAWLINAKPGDEVYLVKQKEFCHIEIEYNSHNAFGCGIIKLVEKEREWIIRPNGTGVNFGLLMVPASCVLSKDEEVIHDILL